MLHLRALSESKGILDIDSRGSGPSLNFRVAEQDLHGA